MGDEIAAAVTHAAEAARLRREAEQLFQLARFHRFAARNFIRDWLARVGGAR